MASRKALVEKAPALTGVTPAFLKSKPEDMEKCILDFVNSGGIVGISKNNSIKDAVDIVLSRGGWDKEHFSITIEALSDPAFFEHEFNIFVDNLKKYGRGNA